MDGWTFKLLNYVKFQVDLEIYVIGHKATNPTING